MQKIMFDDRFGLTQAVLEGRKTMTRRTVGNHMTEDDIKAYLKGYKDVAYNLAPYKIDEVVAVAQSYKDLGYTKEWVEQHIKPNPNAIWNDPFWKKYPGWNNKMFVRTDLISHQIRITDIKVERLQDISDEDCLKEGIEFSDIEKNWFFINANNTEYHASTCRATFASLIDKVSGKGTWEENSWVYVYSFELVK